MISSQFISLVLLLDSGKKKLLTNRLQKVIPGTGHGLMVTNLASLTQTNSYFKKYRQVNFLIKKCS